MLGRDAEGSVSDLSTYLILARPIVSLVSTVT